MQITFMKNNINKNIIKNILFYFILFLLSVVAQAKDIKSHKKNHDHKINKHEIKKVDVKKSDKKSASHKHKIKKVDVKKSDKKSASHKHKIQKVSVKKIDKKTASHKHKIKKVSVKKIDKKSGTKKTVKKNPRKTANFTTKIPQLGSDYHKTFNPTIVQKTVSVYINRIYKICDQKHLPVDQKIINLENILADLRVVINTYLAEPYLKSNDSIYLTSVQYNISRSELSLGKKITPSLINEYKLDLGQIFVNSYSVFYHINRESESDPDIMEVTKNPFFYPSHPWAHKIYKGLKCVLQK